MKESIFKTLMKEKKFSQAKELVKDFLRKAKLADPRNDETYYIPVDRLGSAILYEEGPEAFCEYNIELLELLEKELEPEWGHLHKGHFLYRIGVGKLAINLSEAKKFLKESYKEGKITIKQYQDELSLKVPLEVASYKYPDHVLLMILDIIGDEYFSTEEEKTRFLRGMAFQNWDHIWEPRVADQDLVLKSIKDIVPKEGLAQIIKIHQELNEIYVQEKPASTMIMMKYFLEVILYCIFYYKLKIETVNNKKIINCELYDFLVESEDHDLFPNDAIRTFFYLVYILLNKMYKFKREMSDYILNIRVEKRIVVCIKSLLDLNLIEWQREL